MECERVFRSVIGKEEEGKGGPRHGVIEPDSGDDEGKMNWNHDGEHNSRDELDD